MGAISPTQRGVSVPHIGCGAVSDVCMMQDRGIVGWLPGSEVIFFGH